jgi:hypothetical protein
MSSLIVKGSCLSLSNLLSWKHSGFSVDNSILIPASRQSWARLIQKVYKIDPLVCPQCGQEMRIISVITDPFEVNKILECRKKNNAPVFDKEVTKVS